MVCQKAQRPLRGVLAVYKADLFCKREIKTGRVQGTLPRGPLRFPAAIRALGGDEVVLYALFRETFFEQVIQACLF
jgi:hypothetical protein